MKVCKDVDLRDDLNVIGISTFHSNMDVNADIDLGDNNKLLIGDGNDLQIYHNGSNSYIEDGGTGALIIKTNSFNGRNGRRYRIHG